MKTAGTNKSHDSHETTFSRFAAATIFACAAACSESGIPTFDPENETGGNAGNNGAEPFYITASIDDSPSAAQGPDSRVTVDDPGSTAIKFRWEEGDVIHVLNSAAAGSSIDYKFTAVEIFDGGMKARFRSPDNYPANAVPAFAMWLGSWNGIAYNPANIILPTAFATADQLMDSYWLYAKFDTQNNV